MLFIESQRKPRIALVCGGWGQNIGNAFFNIGGHYVLSEVFGQGQVGFHQDQPNYRTLHNKFKGNPVNYVDLISYMDIDYVVLQGPVFNPWIYVSWAKTFKALKRRGVKIAFLSSAFFKFRDKEYATVRGFLEEFPPAFISTRDSRSYEILKGFFPKLPIFDGIDSGFFLNRTAVPFGTSAFEPFCAFTFDRYSEPTFMKSAPDPKKYESKKVWILNKTYYAAVPKFLHNSGHKSKIWAYIGDYFDRRRHADKIDGFNIVRPEHRSYPHITYKIYRHPNATASDDPWTYVNIYGNATFTLSDRVHACVASLTYGKQAMLFTPSPRSSLFDRVGVESIREQLCTLDLDFLTEQQEKEISWVRNHV